MSLFQKSVETKYLNELDSALIDKKFDEFKVYFGNSEIQENIRNSKEEQFQEGFLRELFVKIFDYTLNPHPNFNLTTELKNVSNSKKADGAILRNENAIAVIELKSTDTTDLGKVETQAFGYKNHHPKCVYVITSNFEKLRFYIQNAVNHFEFDLFKLTKEEFSLLWLCLAKDNLLNDLPLKIKESSLAKEENITKQLYSDYSKFREALYQNLVKNNPEVDKLTLFKKTQKLIDRFLFIFFAEDKQLLPANSILQIIEKWKDDVDFGDVKSLYSLFRKYFHILNVGRPKSEKRQEIFAYNGGLFLTDEILENVKIDDDVLKEHILKLSNYDFDTEVDVNILGHIFEHSLGEIENVQAEIKGENIDYQKTKRKKDGIFYTPKYITKYIVENSIGKLCEEKRNSFGIVDEEYAKGRKNRRKEIIKELDEKLKKYQDWLISLTILDPACGSGAFLNQALEFLIEEHRKIDELRTQLFGGGLIFSDISTDILEKNIYGVDINEESVEIAKLSLWLRTARKGRKLSTLSNNIKCGNSLIKDPEIAGDKAFNWELEFSEIFSKGGFDVVIGNPPYVNANEVKKNSTVEQYNYLKGNYETAKGTVDLYIYFFEKGLSVIRNSGLLSYITPNRFLSASYGKALREYILNNNEIVSLIDYSDKKVFSDASTYPVITIIRKGRNENYSVLTGKFNEVSKTIIGSEYPSNQLNILQESILGFLLNDKITISKKVINQSVSLENAGRINATSTASEADDYSSLITENEGFKLINTGTIDPYSTTWGVDLLTDKGKRYIKPYLPLKSEIISENRIQLYSSPKIIISKIGLKCEAFYDNNGEYASINTNCIHSFSEKFLPEYILCWLNSKLYNYIYECLFDGLRMSGGYLLFSSPNLKNTYIKELGIEQQSEFIPLSNFISEKIKLFINERDRFVTLLKSKFSIEKLPQKIINWYKLENNQFLKELKTLSINLNLTEESEWLSYFNQQKETILLIDNQIAETENKINHLIYEFYNLSNEEIIEIESSMK
jgi:type I restriction-modification system DNA methylase subunit